MVVVPAAVVPRAVDSRGNGPVEALIIDRQPLFLAALASLLSSPGVDFHAVCALRSDIGLQMIRDGDFDLVCCEMHSEPIAGVELAHTLANEDRHTPVILLADEDDEPQVESALAAGVSGLFTKNADANEFIAGIRAVLDGHRAIGESVIGHMIAVNPARRLSESRPLGNQLSPTELEILSLIGQAQSIPAIAATRGIAHKTVRNHLARIYRKLELHNRTEAMLWAARMGLSGG